MTSANFSWCLLLAATPTWCTELDRAVTFNIAAQPIDSALIAFSRQANIQVIIAPDATGGTTVPALNGTISAHKALDTLLANTGLRYAAVGHTVSVTRLADRAVHSAQASPTDDGTVPEQALAADSTQASLPASSSNNDRLSDSKRLGSVPEVVVTAQKRTQALKDVPMNIAVVSSEQLIQRGIRDTVDLALSVPGIGIQDRGGASFRYIFLRGLGNTRGSQTMVGVYLDEQDVTSFPFNALDLRAYDMERLEVLRGPQGTLYGSGAMGGVLRYITKKVDLATFSGKADVTAVATEHGDPGGSVSGSLNIPLIDGTLGLRLSGLYENSGGWIDQPAVSRSNINNDVLYSLRIKSLWVPMEAVEVAATVMAQRNDAGAPDVGEDNNGNFSQSFGRASTPSGSNRYETYGLVAKYSLDHLQLVSSSGYFHYSNSQRNIGYAFPTAPPPAVANDLLADPSLDTSVRAFSQELRAAYVGTNGFTWTAGTSYRDAERVETSALLYGLPTSTDPALINTPTNETSRGWAVFTESSKSFQKRITLGAGLRYYRDTQENKLTNQDGDFGQWSPRFFGTFAVTDAINLYVNVAKGFRSGGFNSLFSISRGAPPTYKSDEIWSYEFGSKGTLFDRLVKYDLAAFYGDYKGAQDSGFRQVGNVVINVVGNIGDAAIKGIDWDVSFSVSSKLSVGTSGEYVDGKYTRIDAISATQAVGDPLKQIPKYQANVWSLYEMTNWLGGDRSYLRIDYNKRGVAEYRNRSVGPWYVSTSDPIDMLNASVGWEKGKWSASLFARNVLDARGYIDAESIDRLASRPRPRSYGLNAGFTF